MLNVDNILYIKVYSVPEDYCVSTPYVAAYYVLRFILFLVIISMLHIAAYFKVYSVPGDYI
jgi:hypothetical protein